MNKILLVSHQLDHSGSPNALLSAARVMLDMGLNIELLSLADGPLEIEFRNIGVSRIRNTDFRGYDLVVLNTAVCSRLASYIPACIRYIIWIHESPTLFIHSDLPFIVGEAARRASGVIFPSRCTADEWLRYGTFKNEYLRMSYMLSPITLPNVLEGATDHGCTFNNELSSFQIISIDPIEHFRGHRVISAAINVVVKKGFKIRFIAVGAEWTPTKTIFSDLLESAEIEATGRIPRNRVIEHLADSHVYVSASSYATQNLGLCEATLLGIPAVVSDISVHRRWAETVGPSVRLARLFDAHSLATGLIEVFDSYDSYKSISIKSTSTARALLSEENFRLHLKSFLASLV